MNDGSPPNDLRRLLSTEREKRMLLRAEAVIAAERDHIVGKGKTADVEWSGIGLSGGGIRSASLALGVLQALVEHDLLRNFHYISSVSGGGYIASSLQWWWSKQRLAPSAVGTGGENNASSKDETVAKPRRYGTNFTNFPYGPAHPGATSQQERGEQASSTTSSPQPHPRAAQNLSFLRAHSSYLTPGHGLNIWSLIGVLLRTIVISIATWLPLLAIVMGLLFLIDAGIGETIASRIRLFAPLGDLIPVVWKDYTQVEPVSLELEAFRYRAVFALPLLLSYLLLGAFICAAILFALVSRAPQDSTADRSKGPWIVAILAAFSLIIIIVATFDSLDASIVILLAVATVFVAVVATTLIADYRSDKNLNPSYMLRRKIETAMGNLFIPTLVCFALGTIPFIPYYVAKNLPHVGATTGAFSVLAGVISALYGYYTFLRNIIPSLVGQIVATLGAVIYLYATLVFSYILILMMKNPEAFVSEDGTSLGLRIGIPLAMILAIAIAVRGNINFVGLHRFYRDRLMEAFMPTDMSVDKMTSGFSPFADNLSVSDLGAISACGLPYPIINSNLILINDPHQKYSSRGGDNFIISPLYVGSTATGWQPTSDYIKANGPLTLPSAMAASGAAASASAGYIGTGITMNRLVSAVMSLLNIRLGLWVGNPFFKETGKIRRIPTFLNPGLVSGIFQLAHTFDSTYLELTDGGHFENLGLYELVRRRTKVILIVDAEADPKISLSSLVSAIRRIEEDFGATLEFEEGMGPARLVMYPKRDYPSDVRYAAAPFMIGKLTYRHITEKEGLLIYIKSTLVKGLDFRTAGYLASNPNFPHQSTVDQFFDPAQFDAYRCLGYENAQAALSALKKSPSISSYAKMKAALAAAAAIE